MRLKEAKEFTKTYGLYGAISYLCEAHTQEDCEAIKEIVFRVLDNIPEKIFKKALNKGTK